MARDFSSDFVFKTAGILDVFQGFYKHKLEQKNGHFAEREFLEVPHYFRGHISLRYFCYRRRQQSKSAAYKYVSAHLSQKDNPFFVKTPGCYVSSHIL